MHFIFHFYLFWIIYFITSFLNSNKLTSIYLWVKKFKFYFKNAFDNSGCLNSYFEFYFIEFMCINIYIYMHLLFVIVYASTQFSTRFLLPLTIAFRLYCPCLLSCGLDTIGWKGMKGKYMIQCNLKTIQNYFSFFMKYNISAFQFRWNWTCENFGNKFWK